MFTKPFSLPQSSQVILKRAVAVLQILNAVDELLRFRFGKIIQHVAVHLINPEKSQMLTNGIKQAFNGVLCPIRQIAVVCFDHNGDDAIIRVE